MTEKEIIDKIESTIDNAKAAILSTVDSDGKPHMRWMSPVLLPGEQRTLYSITSPEFSKIEDLKKHPDVEWMIQTKDLRRVINVRGKMNIIENQTLRARVMERIANQLNVFWKLQKDSTDFLVLETVIEEAVYFVTMKGTKTRVAFSGD